jgi:hypothetical protein
MLSTTRLRLGAGLSTVDHTAYGAYESQELTDALAVSTAVIPDGSAAEQRPVPRRWALPLRAARERKLLRVWPRAVNRVRAAAYSGLHRAETWLAQARGPAQPHACTVRLQGCAIFKMLLVVVSVLLVSGWITLRGTSSGASQAAEQWRGVRVRPVLPVVSPIRHSPLDLHCILSGCYSIIDLTYS